MGDCHHVIIPCQSRAVCAGSVGALVAAIVGVEASAMVINHYRPIPSVCDARRPHVQVEAVLAGNRLGRKRFAPLGRLGLYRLGAVEQGVSHTLPLPWLRWRFEAILANRRVGVGNTFEYRYSVF